MRGQIVQMTTKLGLYDACIRGIPPNTPQARHEHVSSTLSVDKERNPRSIPRESSG